MSIANRLESTLSKRGKSRHWLHKRLHDMSPSVRGSAYASVRSYCRGEKAPPLEFLVAAAEALKVRLEWLREGEGEPTPWDAQFKLLEEESTGGDLTIDSLFTSNLHEALKKHTKYDATWIDRMRPVVQVRFAEIWHRYSKARHPDVEPVQLSPAMGVGLFKVLMRPLELVGPGKRMDLRGDDFTDYALAALNALSQALRVPKDP